MRGRKPVAAPVNVVDLPASMARVPQPPKTLKHPRARECWGEVTRMMVSKNLWDVDISDMVEVYCVQRARWLEADENIYKTGGLMVPSKKAGRLMYNAWVGISNSAYDRMVKIASELCITTVRRGRAVKATGLRTNTTGASKFLKSG